MSMRGQTIVVVDDEPHIRHVIRRKLQRAGYRVHTACDGTEALQLVTEVSPALVITDLIMPNMDGFELSAACREDPQTREIPIILVTGSVITTAQIQPRLESLKNISCISKPFSPRELLRKVQELVPQGTPNTS
jgi:CheY-like chemotaxis protein